RRADGGNGSPQCWQAVVILSPIERAPMWGPGKSNFELRVAASLRVALSASVAALDLLAKGPDHDKSQANDHRSDTNPRSDRIERRLKQLGILTSIHAPYRRQHRPRRPELFC